MLISYQYIPLHGSGELLHINTTAIRMLGIDSPLQILFGLMAHHQFIGQMEAIPTRVHIQVHG